MNMMNMMNKLYCVCTLWGPTRDIEIPVPVQSQSTESPRQYQPFFVKLLDRREILEKQNMLAICFVS